ncbi:MAG: alcohol dehydrogenase catalytic domain-containing protein [Dehalococcoidia bacterium]|jgi:D-arabinitol dehydrogenase (NADP+)|nr:alcohol dehydrogenase catalytic domain-containing protein [Dehalococcoidia bacterium]
MTWHGAEKFSLDQVPNPGAHPGRVVVKMDTVGVCGTDVHITQGLFPSTPPRVLGHEGSGVIVEVGEGVDSSRIGERVVMNTTSWCGECPACKTWSISRCENADQSSGMFAEYATAPSQAAVRIPDGLDLELAALTEPAACCLSGAEMMDIPDEAVGVVIGGGIMGLFTLAFLKRRGVETMIMSEPVAARREMATQFGADLLHNPADSDLTEFVKDQTGGYGANIASEAVGIPALVAKCVELVRPRGQVLMIGVCPEGAPLPVDLYDMHYREITLKGAFGRGDVFARTPEEINKLDLDGVISGRYALQDVPQAIVDSGEGKGVKFVIKPNG